MFSRFFFLLFLYVIRGLISFWLHPTRVALALDERYAKQQLVVVYIAVKQTFARFPVSSWKKIKKEKKRIEYTKSSLGGREELLRAQLVEEKINDLFFSSALI